MSWHTVHKDSNRPICCYWKWVQHFDMTSVYLCCITVSTESMDRVQYCLLACLLNYNENKTELDWIELTCTQFLTASESPDPSLAECVCTTEVMLTPCLFIPWSTAAAVFPLFDILSRRSFSHFHPSAVLKFLRFPLCLLSDQMLINSLHVVTGCGGWVWQELWETQHGSKNWSACFCCSDRSHSKVQMYLLMPCVFSTVWN